SLPQPIQSVSSVLTADMPGENLGPRAPPWVSGPMRRGLYCSARCKAGRDANDREVGIRHRPRQVVDTAAADVQTALHAPVLRCGIELLSRTLSLPHRYGVRRCRD